MPLTTSPTEATILYAPPQTTNPLDACQLSDLIASLKTNSFHTPFEVTLTPRKRVSKSSNTFFCPVCPSSPIVITKSPFTITCPACKWNAADHGITTVSDLLLADSRPYHELLQRIPVLGEQLFSRDPLTPDGWELGDGDSEIPVEKRFDSRVTRRAQEPARRRINSKMTIAVNGTGVGIIENGVWKLKHGCEKILPDLRVSQSGAALSLLVRNVHDMTMHVRVGEEECSLAKGGEHEFTAVARKIAGWGMVDMELEYDEGVYCGEWKVRLFIK